MRTFKTKPFARFARREGIGDGALCDAAVRALAGEMLGLDEAGVEAMLANGAISEVNCND